MFCKKCGTILDDDALFCENCGTSVKRIAPAVPSVEVPVVEEASAPTESIAEEATPAASITEEAAPAESIPEEAAPVIPQVVAVSKKPFTRWILIAGVLIVIAAIAIGLIFGLGGNDSDSFYQQMNFNNIAHFAYDSERLYFIADYTEDAESTSVYSTDYKGLNKKLISEDGDINRIRVIDGKIYYSASTDGTHRIGVMDTDGSNDRTIISLETSAYEYDVSGNTLYYKTDSQLYSCSLDGEDNIRLLEEVASFIVDKNTLYYVSNDIISKYDIKKGTSTELCQAEDVWDLALNGNTLYFTSQSGLCSTDVKGDGSVTHIINDSDLSSYVFQGDYIYYCHEFTSDEVDEIAAYLADDSDESWYYSLLMISTGKLHQANLDGTNVHEVENTNAEIVCRLYSFPEGLYYKITAFADELEPVEFY